MHEINRRDFLKLTGVGGAVFASGLGACSTVGSKAAQADFYFVQLSDTHWGFNGPVLNPDAKGTLPKAVAAVNSLDRQPDFIMFTGDLTHTTDDPQERRRRLAEFKQIVGALKNRTCASCRGNTTRRSTGPGLVWNSSARRTTASTTRACISSSWTMCPIRPPASARRSSPGSRPTWMRRTRTRASSFSPTARCSTWRRSGTGRRATAPVRWNYSCRIANVTVFYGHIHQEHHHMTGHIAHHSAKSLIFPLPAPGATPKRDPIRWNPAEPYRGLGFREVDAELQQTRYSITEIPLKGA